jgi:pimeloyl-ACP methyl ester carboxylesterase
MNQIITGYAQVNGAMLYYEMAGAGEPLVLLHAGVADGRMWDEQFAVFAESYRVVRYDMRGFGRSAVPPGAFSHHEDLAGLLDYLQIDRVIVVGISNGGRIALDFALVYPERVRTLVLAAPSVGGSQPSARIRQFWEEEDAAIERGDWETAIEVNLRAWVDGIHRQPEQVDTAVRQKVARMQREIFDIPVPDDAKEQSLQSVAYGRLAEITIPTLILIGDLDLPEKVEQAHWLATQIPNAQIATIPGVAHMLNMEAPTVFNKLVLDFLAI